MLSRVWEHSKGSEELVQALYGEVLGGDVADSIYFKGHTCCKNGWSGVDTIKPINVIIGRNNAGQSHLLELVDALCSGPCQNRGQMLSTSRGALHLANENFTLREETSRSDRTSSR